MAEAEKMIKTVNFISGSGTTNLAILEAENLGGALHGLAETLAIVSSDPKAPGIDRAKKVGFNEKNIFIVDPTKDLTPQLLPVLDKYKPDYFHQLGWFPMTPIEVINQYTGLNQHLGPGGKWMYGIRRIYAHIRFCEMIGEDRPIPIFCHLITPQKPNYDEGDTVFVKWEKILENESAEEALARFAPIEHEVQIEALRLLVKGLCKLQTKPEITKTKEEEKLLMQAKIEARTKYPPDKHLLYLPK